MTELAPAKVRIEIFREPGFFDDHFCKGWSVISGDVGFDGEEVQLIGFGAAARIEKSFVIFSEIHGKIQVRISLISGTNTTWGVKVYDQNAAEWLDVWTGQTGTGIFETSLPEGKYLTKIALLEEYAGDMQNKVYFDYVAVCKNTLLVPDLGDIVEELTVTRPLLSKGISGAQFSIPNFSGAYNGKIKGHDVVIIWLARDEADLGKVANKVFGGRVVTPSNRGVRYGEFYVDLDCHGHAYELNIPPALLQKLYSGTNGRTIIEEALALCNYLTKHPEASKWFDNAGASGSTDDRINSTHDIVYDEELLMTVIQEILEKAKNPSAVQGFDAYETPSGVLVGHLRNSLDFVSPIASVTPRNYQKSEDIYRIRNKIKVYGMMGKSLPSDEDAWTENSASSWVAVEGTVSDTTVTDPLPKKGNKALKFAVNAATPHICHAYYNLPSTLFVSKTHKKINFWKNINRPDATSFQVRLYTDVSNYFAKELACNEAQYILERIDCGPEAEGWIKVGTPNWGNITKIGFYLSDPNGGVFYIDNLFFSEIPFVYTVEDATSQNLYGVRCSEPITDEALKSDAECQARAESILAVLKDPVITLSQVVVDGDHRYNPGDRQRIVVSNDNLDSYFPIIEVKHTVKGTQWDVTLAVNNEPQYIDYVFRLIQQTTKLLGRKS